MRTGYNGVEIRKRRRTTLGKSIYSLALSDEIIREIDALAYEQNTNRSSLINSILADFLQLTTPEQRMREVFDRMETLLLGSDTFPTPFQLLSLPSDTMMNLRSSIRYKYNPTAKYSVELYRQPEDGVFGELRVSIRTQNRTLIGFLQDFYDLWAREESRYRDVEYTVDEQGRYARKLRLSFNTDGEEALSGLTVGDVLSRYITAFDKALKSYFDALQEDGVTREQAERGIRDIYEEYSKGEVVL